MPMGLLEMLLSKQPAMRGSQPQQVPRGLLETGNIDLYARPVVQNPDGSISTVLSMSFGTDQGEILVPMVSDDGRVLSEQQAIDLYRKTGKHLGIFKTPQDATAFAESLHNQQAGLYAKPRTRGK
jgi:hypothetical protein